METLYTNNPSRNVGFLTTSSPTTGIIAVISRLKIYIGGSWVAKVVKGYIGGSWETKPIKSNNGSTWV
jgi:hypothetical protein